MHRKSERNEYCAHPSTLIVNIAAARHRYIHFREIFNHIPTRARILATYVFQRFPSFSFSFSSWRYIHENTVGFPDFTLFSHSTIFLLHSSPSQSGIVPVVWTTTRILFRRLRATFPARKSLCDFCRTRRHATVHLPVIFLLKIQIYTYIMTNDVSKLFKARYLSADLSIRQYSSNLSNELCDQNFLMSQWREGLGNAKSHVSRKCARCGSMIAIYENAVF